MKHNQLIDYLVKYYTSQAKRTITNLVDNSSSHQDILQNFWVRTMESIHRFQGKSHIKTWAHGLLVNTIREYFRAEGKYVPSNHPHKKVESDPRTRADKQLEHQEFAYILKTGISMWSKKAKEVMFPLMEGDESREEIASRLELNIRTLYSRINHARGKLNTYLEKHY